MAVLGAACLATQFLGLGGMLLGCLGLLDLLVGRLASQGVGEGLVVGVRGLGGQQASSVAGEGRAAALLGVDIADCLALVDSPTGVASAAAAGAWVVAIPHLAPVVMAPRVRTIPTLDGTTLMALWQHVRA